MFTGIIEEVGTVRKIAEKGGNRRIYVSAKDAPRELKMGNSIAVSGVCLTAVEIGADFVAADLAQETWTRTSFSRIREGAKVNLELPMRADGRMGGHIVQGHVDGTGRFVGLEPISGTDNFWLHVEIPKDLERYVAFKGSIAIEGISLTVAKVDGTLVTVAIIPHTVEMTNLGTLNPGDPVNIETDIIAKYVEKMLTGERVQGAISLERLVSEGF